MEDLSAAAPEQNLGVESNKKILAKETEQICSFYEINKDIRDRVASLPINEVGREQAVERIEKQEDMELSKPLPEGEAFDAVAQALGTSRKEILRKRQEKRMRELDNISGYYYRGRKNPEIVLLKDRNMSTPHVIRHEIIHAIRSEIEPDKEKVDEREGVVEGLELFSRPGKKPESPRDFLKLRQEIISGEIKVGFPQDVNRFITALGATYTGDNPLSIDEAAKIHFEEGDTLLSIQVSSRVSENIRENVNELLLKLK